MLLNPVHVFRINDQNELLKIAFKINPQIAYRLPPYTYNTEYRKFGKFSKFLNEKLGR